MSRAGRPIRAYLDTSVFGGVFDLEFAKASRALFERVDRAEVVVLVSEVTEREIAGAPPQVQALLPMIPAAALQRCPLTDEILTLAQEYIKAQVVAPKWEDDCLHVACATLYRADVLVSWNFKHLVRLDRARAFNSVNLRLGYPQITIASPLEIQYADRDDDT